MQIPLEITFHNLPPSEALERKVRDRVDKLHRYFDRIIGCHVVIEVPHRSRSQAHAYHVRITVQVPEKVLVVNRGPGDPAAHFDPNLVIRDAFDAMDRQLEEHARKMRGAVKTLNEPLRGKVLRLFQDHGFIATTDGREVYFHRNSVVGAPFDKIEEGDPVELVLIHGESPDGPQATTVKPIRPMRLAPDPTVY